jgi:hypothetical protein
MVTVLNEMLVQIASKLHNAFNSEKQRGQLLEYEGKRIGIFYAG